MAPIDRTEHRQQRIRGAGIGSIQTSFDFNLGGLVPKVPKQASLPPQRSSRRTPIEGTPRAEHGSAKRHRSAKARNTPDQSLVTPQLGKRKRGSSAVQPVQQDEDEVDELSPEHGGEVQSVEKSRRAAVTVSPISEEYDNLPDELSLVDNVMSSAQRNGLDVGVDAPDTPVPVRKPRLAPRDAQQRPPDASTTVKQGVARSAAKAASTEPIPNTPVGNLVRQPRNSTLSATNGVQAMPSLIQDVDSDVDELSPQQPANGVVRRRLVASRSPPEDNGELDELSPMSVRANQPGSEPAPRQRHGPQPETEKKRKPPPSQRPPNARVRSRRIVDEEEEDIMQSSPAVSKAQIRPGRSSQTPEEDLGDDDIDELSPEGMKTKRGVPSQTSHRRAPRVAPSVKPTGGQDESDEEDAPDSSANHAPPVKPHGAAKKGQTHSHNDEPPKKRLKRGPTWAVEVMRLKGFGLKGYTVVDTTRKAAQEWITAHVRRMTEKISAVADKDKARAKAIHQERNLVVAYSEKLDDIFLDLQDANNSGLDNTGRLKQLRKQGKQLMGEYIQTQRERDQIALQNDEITETFSSKRRQAEARHHLSESLYNIQAAIKNGKDRAQAEGRENEGPEVPLSMLLDNVARDVGPGGLLANVSDLNGALERAADLLEGRI
ncbi:hypothetical protein K491DRAFT_779639 [Lophiostoma macrostomum CBS 122681]|uniref:AT hook domain-containing protein n=1 Tax=Lophiostoma macrostomum CBS 122681 TaxID=1314788 RepID=A0A6A6T5Z2_9PLEO|nr:hypothetical protein K491DRAFT_779639 [Lophiostoma macrostomum CBS 122681]